MQWIYGLFLDLMSYCANALLGVMSTDLSFFETSVPIVPDLYKIFVAIGWGLLIGNCAFQCMKAMFAGLGFETESPAILLMRTFLFGFLLIFSGDICEIGLSIGKRVIDLLGIPSSITLTMPNDSMFSGVGASWLLVIIIGFVLGFQLIKLFFEIAERYVVVAVLTLLCPVGLALGGSKSTKDICSGFIRMYASMIVMMVMNVLFLKLILSALATMPTGALVLPWCLLVVGIAKTARKADNLISRIGLNPAITGDPLGAGRGFITIAMAARTIMAFSGKGGGGRSGGGAKAPSGSRPPSGGSGGAIPNKTGGAVNNNSSRSYGGNTGNTVRNTTGGTSVGGSHTGGNNVGGNTVGGSNVGGSNVSAGTTFAAASDTSTSSQRNAYANNMGGSRNVSNNQASSNVRFGANTYNAGGRATASTSNRTQFSSTGKAQVNTNRFGSQPGAGQPVGSSKPGGNAGAGSPGAVQNKGTNPAAAQHQNVAKTQPAQAGQQPGKHGTSAVQQGNTTAKTGGRNARGGANTQASQRTPRGATQAQPTRNAAQTATNNAKKSRFGSGPTVGGVRQNANPIATGKAGVPPVGMVRTTPYTTKNSAFADVVEKTDTLQEVIQTVGAPAAPKDGEDNG